MVVEKQPVMFSLIFNTLWS